MIADTKFSTDCYQCLTSLCGRFPEVILCERGTYEGDQSTRGTSQDEESTVTDVFHSPRPGRGAQQEGQHLPVAWG